MTVSGAAPGEELNGVAAVVTGASSGIGRAIALELSRAGAEVLLHARANEDGCRSTAAEARTPTGPIVLADLAEPAGRRRLLQEAYRWRPDIGIWVNNAGADVLTGEASQESFGEKLSRLWRVDVEATVWLSREVGRRMGEAHSDGKTPAILNMGWDQVETGMAGDSGEMFAAVKGAVMAFSRSLAASLAPHVRVNCLAPGWIQTGWGQNADAYWQERAQRESLMQRWGVPEDVAAVARFLVSPAADFITGQVVPVNGGQRREPPGDVHS